MPCEELEKDHGKPEFGLVGQETIKQIHLIKCGYRDGKGSANV